MRQGLLVSILLTGLICGTVWAVGGDMGEGDGSEENPYLIEDVNDFDVFAGNSAYWEDGVHTKLMTDIDLSGRTYTTAVIAPDRNRNGQFRDTPYSGSFNGNGFCVSNLTIDSMNEGLGLFGAVRGFITNLGVENINISGSPYYSGGLCGWNLSGVINNCYTTGQIINGAVIGGLCGRNSQMASITNCYSACKVVGTSDQYAGGLCADNSGVIVCCYSTGEVSDDVKHGGLCGSNYSGSIVKCFWDTEASGKTSSDGGTGKTTAQIQDIQTFLTAGWDFVDESSNGTSNFWKISTNEYPSLAVFSDDFIFYTFIGLGTEADPYLIRNGVDIGAIWQQPEKCFQLTNTIDLSNIQWSIAPIPFLTGSFSGNNNTISSLTINGGGFLGLFGWISSNSSIHSLHLEDISLTGKGHLIGSLCGFNNSRNISACYASNVTINVADSKSFGIGGLCGWNEKGILSNCHATGSVNGINVVGGICGMNYNGTITECYFSGTVSGDSSVGGLCGQNRHPDAVITDCYVNGIVNGSGEGIGGLCGKNDHGGEISDCYADCQVNGTGEDSESIGGLCGYNEIGTITNCYSKGSVVGNKSSELGGLCGINHNGKIYHCYSNTQVSGGSAVGGLCGTNYLALIEESYAAGHVFGTQSSAGGFCGYDLGDIRNCYATGDVYGNQNVGGFVGYKYNYTISNCYSTGYVFGLQNVGGFAGGFFRDYIRYCFWDTETSETTTGIGSGSATHLYGCTTEQMQMESTFTSQWWDFWNESANGWEDIWRLCSGYPRLMFEFPQGDIVCGDGVNLNDFAYLAKYWWDWDCYFYYTNGCRTADINGDGLVTFEDLALIAEDWLYKFDHKEDLRPVAHWRLDNNTNDSSGNGYHGTLYGNPSYWLPDDWLMGCGIALDGVDDYVQITGYKGITGTANRTCTAWIKTSVSRPANILSWGTDQAGQKWMFRIETDGALGVGVWGGYISSADIVNDGQWHHVTASLADDGSPSVDEILLYIDGQLQDATPSNTQTIDTAVEQDVLIGAVEYSETINALFPGMIDEVRIYDRALTDEEVQIIAGMGNLSE